MLLTTYLLTYLLPIYLRTSHKQAGSKCRVKPQRSALWDPLVGPEGKSPKSS